MTEGLPKHLLFLKDTYFKMLTIWHNIFTVTAHGRALKQTLKGFVQSKDSKNKTYQGKSFKTDKKKAK